MDIHSRTKTTLRNWLPASIIALLVTLFVTSNVAAQELNSGQSNHPPDYSPSAFVDPVPNPTTDSGATHSPNSASQTSAWRAETSATQGDVVSSQLSVGTFREPREVDASQWQSPSTGHSESARSTIPDSSFQLTSYDGENGSPNAASDSRSPENKSMRPPSSGPPVSIYEELPRTGVPNRSMTPGNPVTVGAVAETVSPTGYQEQGRELEQSGQWGEALALYQQALKEFPKNAALVQRRSMARLHFDLDRRYSDTSFLSTISETSGTKALNVYAEVLLRVQSYYVDEPQWNELAGYGLTSLEVALETPSFRQRNLRGVTDQQIARAVDVTRAELRKLSAETRNDAYVIAGTAARTMESEIGLAPQATVYEFVCGAISALDPYSAFMSSNQYTETMSQIEGNFVGLGVELRTHKDHLEIVSVINGGSASHGGITRGDRIIAVDDMAVAKVGSERAADMLRGVEGSFVRVAVDRGGIPRDIDLERKRVEIPSVDGVRMVDPGRGVGYIQLTNFQKTTARDFDAALWQLQRQGMRSLIVDVRGNPGGLLSASVEVADRFIGSGVIVSTRGRNPLEDYTHRAESAGTWNLPLVVLIDENSASASEIFAAAIRDHQAGKIVGERSYGKGSVQGIFPLNISGGGVRLTTAKFYSPTGKAISEVGVDADYAVTEVARPTASGRQIDADSGLRIGIQIARQLTTAPPAEMQTAVTGR